MDTLKWSGRILPMCKPCPPSPLPLWSQKCLQISPGTWLTVCRALLRWGLWGLFPPLRTQTWTSASWVRSGNFEKNREGSGCEDVSEEGERIKRPDLPRAGGDSGREWEWGTHVCAWPLTQELLPDLHEAPSGSRKMTTQRLVLCGFRVYRLLHQSPLLRAMASSLQTSLFKNWAYLVFSLGAPIRTDMWTSSTSHSSRPRPTWSMRSRAACLVLFCVSGGIS